MQNPLDVPSARPLLAPARSFNALVGGSVGFLLALLYVLSDGLRVWGHHEGLFILVGVAVGALTGWFQLTRAAAVLALGAAGCGAVLFLTPVLRGPMNRWIRSDSIPASTQVDGVVVLSSGISSEGLIDPTATARLLSGMQLAHRIHAPLLITTSFTDTLGGRPVPSLPDQRALVALGWDTTAWKSVSPVATTRDEAVRTSELLAPASSHRIAVVTSPSHSRRACAVFEGVGFRVLCVPAAERRYAVHRVDDVTARYHAFMDYLYERLAMIKYRSRGWITS